MHRHRSQRVASSGFRIIITSTRVGKSAGLNKQQEKGVGVVTPSLQCQPPHPTLFMKSAPYSTPSWSWRVEDNCPLPDDVHAPLRSQS